MASLPELWQRLTRNLLAIHREAEPGAAGGPEALSVHPWPLVVLLTCAASMTLLNVVGVRMNLGDWNAAYRKLPNYQLFNLVYWVFWCALSYVVLPSVALLLFPRWRPRHLGLSPQGYLGHLPTYLMLFAAVAPLVVVASFGEAFQHMYPFYDHAGRSWRHLLAWELLYGTQFLCLEFFFRGFLLFGLVRYIGAYAIFVMIVPYCMLHFGKPAPEIAGSVVAGVILGTLALRTGSIWGGVTVHVLVAISMDLLALWHTHRLPAAF
jgi:membrane protease YdiL (CAAX protease family)